MNRNMEIRIKTATKKFILPHKKNALMTHKEELVQLIISQYSKLYLNPPTLVSAKAFEDSTPIEYRPFVISMKCGDVDT